MFEVGKMVRCIKGSVNNSGTVKYIKGMDYPLYGLNEGCCGLELDIGLVVLDNDLYVCSHCACEVFWNSGEPYWVESRDFIPLDEIHEIEVLEQQAEKEVELEVYV